MASCKEQPPVPIPPIFCAVVVTLIVAPAIGITAPGPRAGLGAVAPEELKAVELEGAGPAPAFVRLGLTVLSGIAATLDDSSVVIRLVAPVVVRRLDDASALIRSGVADGAIAVRS